MPVRRAERDSRLVLCGRILVRSIHTIMRLYTGASKETSGTADKPAICQSAGIGRVDRPRAVLMHAIQEAKAMPKFQEASGWVGVPSMPVHPVHDSQTDFRKVLSASKDRRLGVELPIVLLASLNYLLECAVALYSIQPSMEERATRWRNLKICSPWGATPSSLCFRALQLTEADYV